MDHRNRAAPIALARDQPIPQPKLHAFLAPALGFRRGGDGHLGLATGETIETAGVNQDPRLGPGTPLEGMFVAALRDDHLAHGQFVLAGEQKVPLVMGRNTHHGPGAVIRQHVISDPQGTQFAGGGVAHLGADRNTALGFVFGGAFLFALARHQVTEGLHAELLLEGSEGCHQGMLGGQHHIGGPKNGVWPGGEHRDPLAGGLSLGRDHLKLQFGPGAAPDPVGLHGAHALGPTIELVEIVQQLLGVVGDLQKPLAQFALFHQGAGAPGATFAVHLLIGQHRLVDRVPIDRGVFLIGEAGLQELQEQPLGPAVVIGVAGGHFPLPVDR